jgi:type I restriction enzyme R subunit
MSAGPEFTYVEQPFIDQLISMDWRHVTGSLDHPSVSGRETFDEVLLTSDLRAALLRINKGPDGKPWLDDDRLNQAVAAMEKAGAMHPKLIEANQAATELLLSGTSVDGLPSWDGGRNQTVRYIDWDNPENNDFLVINQFRVDEPGGQAHQFVVPDLVLFVNGIPVAVVECKAPNVADPLEKGIEQLQRYTNQRPWVEGDEGNEMLFHYNQLVGATCFDKACVGTITAQAVHYLEWKDTAPRPMAAVAAELGKVELSKQEMLVAGMLSPAHLLDIIRHFTLFDEADGRTIKIVARYQQFRAALGAIHRLKTGKTRAEDGEHDQRGGIIWHTQGSGKTLTMVFLVRKMRSDPDLRRFRVVIVTDRRDLEHQLSGTAQLVGDNLQKARSIAQLKELLSERGPGLVFGMISKFQDRDGEADTGEAGEAEFTAFSELNPDESVLVMVDEAHRSHTSALHASLMAALPNCAKIGFTGTPIIMGQKRRTHEIFGSFIDRYTIKQSEDDGATVPILYEGRTATGAVADGRDLDEVFEDLFHDRSPEELEAIKKKYATRGNVLEAEKLIAAKARDMLRHYVENVLPNGFKAQVVAVSRQAALRYYDAFRAAQVELVAELEQTPGNLRGLDEEEIQTLSPRRQFLARALPNLELIRELEFAPVFSGDHNDPPAWAQWSDRTAVNRHIARFKKPLMNADPERPDRLAFLIVKSMLLTGFDAPIEQVMYLDRPIKEAELLQAIARVNRTYTKKSAGIVVDYYGVSNHLKEALAAYSEEDVEGALRSLNDELPILESRYRRAMAIFLEAGIHGLAEEEACIQLLGDDRLRADFQVRLKHFLETLDLVMPRPEGLKYLKDAKRLAFIQARARNRYRDDDIRLIGADVGAKVRNLIDEHIISLGIDPKIPPISILDAQFDEHVDREASPRAKASEMEHAIRHHIRKHINEDPELFEQLSERLERILTELKDRWEELVAALREFVQEARAGRSADDTGLDPRTQAPFLGLLKLEASADVELSDERFRDLVPVTVELVEHIQSEIALTGFWRNTFAQDVLRGWIVRYLDDQDILPFDRLPAVADRLVDLARANRDRLAQ